MRRTKFMCFSIVCGLTLLVIVLCLQLDITKTPILASHSDSHWTAPVKKTAISAAGDDKGALHLRRKVLYKVDVHRAVELGLDKDSWNQTSSSPAELVQDDVTLPRKENQTKIVKVVLAEGIMGDRIVPLNRKQRQLEIPGAVKNDHKETVPYHDSVYDYAQEKEDMPSAVFDQDIIALSQVEDIESRGKVGCTNTRRLMMVLSGTIPVETIGWNRVPETKYLGPGIIRSSLVNPHLSDTNRIDKIKTYWKFIILRNPLERLVSAFRNKLEAPLNLSQIYSDTFQMISRTIVEAYHPQKFHKWKASNGSGELRVDFNTYIQWIVDTPNHKLNEHFCPMVSLSQPCRLQYDFYGNFQRISTDVKLVLRKYQVPENYFHDEGYYSVGAETATLLQQYYSTVSKKLKEELFMDFYIELDYYYHLFPADRQSHMELLGVNKFIY